MKIIFKATLCLSIVAYVLGHGYILQPAGRNALWRKNGRSPKHNTDTELNCGGFTTQHTTNGGRCGVCGDPYNSRNPLFVRPGRYANNIIAATYREGQVIDVDIQITANHKGTFVFKIGKLNPNGNRPITQADLKYPVPLADGSPYYDLTSPRNGLYQMKLRLPSGLTCDQCVLQWWWRVGNNWGCENGKCGLGYGDQETFVNCADIKIVGSGGVRPPQPTRGPVQTYPRVTRKTPAPRTWGPQRKTYKPNVKPTRKPTGSLCRGVGVHAKNPAMITWCTNNCRGGHCPSRVCKCM